jgi:hypothetical protein
MRLTLVLLAASFCGARSALAAEEALDGATLSPWWALPFAGLLLSIALLPQLAPRFWHRHFGKVAAAWSALFLVPFAVSQGVGPALGAVLHTALLEYLPFVSCCSRYLSSRAAFASAAIWRARRQSTPGCSPSAPGLRASPARQALPCCWFDR